MKILFVSNINSLESNATSTDIMTYNILYGLSKITKDITLVAISNSYDEQEKKRLFNDYEKLTKRIFVFKSKLGHNKGKYSFITKIFKTYIFTSYKEEIKSLIKNIDDDTIFISHSPSLESIFLCSRLKKIYKKNRWIQYWSDPIALSGINPDDLSLKRMPYIYIEKKCIKNADKIVYGTKTLYNFQMKLFKKFKKNMDYVDVSYKAYSDKYIDKTFENTNDFLYAGNFYKYTRNIKPLCDAFEKMNKGQKLIIYGKGDQYCSSNNIVYNDRISPKDLSEIERKYKNIICLMNSKCIQIPGKTFYDIYSKKNILVIVDGKYKEEIINYLKEYKRFIIVDNNINSIINGISKINSIQIDLERINENFSPEKIANDILK